MVFQFRIISDEEKDFARELIIGHDQTFLDFHHTLQENLNYDPHQLASFFITNHAWEKQLQITLIDMMDSESNSVSIMENEYIAKHFNEKGQRMLYVFDFFSERSFFIELTGIYKRSANQELPSVIFENGSPPQQIDLGLGDDTLGDSDSDDDTSFGFDEDDLEEGFNFSDADELE